MSQFPILIETIEYCKVETLYYLPLMFVLIPYMGAIVLCSFTSGLRYVLLAGMLFYVHTMLVRDNNGISWMISLLRYLVPDKLLDDLQDQEVPYSNFFFIFLIILVHYVDSALHPHSDLSSGHMSVLMSHVLMSVLPVFTILGIVILVCITVILNHPVSTDHTFWKKTWKLTTFVCIMMKIVEAVYLIYGSSSHLVAVVTVLVFVPVLFIVFRCKTVFAASFLIVEVFIHTLYTYRVWNLTGDDDWLPVLHGFFRQFSLVGLLLYVIAHEQPKDLFSVFLH